MNPSIPEDIVIEIFSWLPVKSLMRFKCFTKFFNSLVSKSDFTDIHRCRSMIRPGGTKFFLQGGKFYYTADQQKKHGKNSGSILQIESFGELIPLHTHVESRLNCVNGLFFIWEPLSKQPLRILNPSTREVRFLPNLDEGFSSCHYSVGFEPKEKKYKVLLTAYYAREEYKKDRVFSLGIDESWRETKSIPPPVFYKPGIFFHRGLAIVAFDVKTENSKFIALGDAYDDWWSYELIEFKGKLAFINYEKSPHENIHLFALEQTRKEEEWESISFSFLQYGRTYNKKSYPKSYYHAGLVIWRFYSSQD